jgi:DNA-binding Lrp family transcriptional regulator
MGQTKWQRLKEGKHVRSYRRQMMTATWRAASTSARVVMLAMGLFEDGTNNGEIYFSDRVGAELTGLSRNTVRRALHELQEKGFIYCSARGGFSRKTRHAATYGFTWLAGPKGSEHRAPSHAYEKWQPDGNSRDQILSATGAVSDTNVETAALTGADIEPDEMETSLVSVARVISDIEPQTVSQGIGAPKLETAQRKQANLTRGPFLAPLRNQLIDHLQASQPGEQSRLADRLNIPAGTLSKFINGRNLPDCHAARLASALSSSMEAA